MLEPTSIAELQSMVRSHPRVLAVGGQTKNRLSAVPSDCQKIGMRALSGITEYEPSEYTFTAQAGTAMRDVHAALREKGQYLPCSALFRDSGATLGGAIASGLSGSERFRFGGLRDFLLGVQFVASDGNLVRAGSKVVKNAAGFDIPKWIVGSLGRLGILTEVTFKVFPRPTASATIKVQCTLHREAAERISQAARARWELVAIDYSASERALYLQIGGEPEAIKPITDEILQQWQEDASLLSDQDASEVWNRIREVRAVPPNRQDAVAVKVPVTPKLISPIQLNLDQVQGGHVHYSVAGNAAMIVSPDIESLSTISNVLTEQNLRGLTIVGGESAPLWLGKQESTQIERDLKTAIDPENRFPALHD